VRTALETGGGSGIGRATALRRSRRLRRGRERAAADPLDETVALAGRETIAVPGDVAVEEDAERMVAAALEAFGGLDVLVNNAGAICRGVDTPLAAVDRPGWPVRKAEYAADYPLGRLGEPADIAYLASPDAPWG
jgi:NAD(P)-dependent dehydrogenase (short-subunit alcohol dehydrogenase family)